MSLSFESHFDRIPGRYQLLPEGSERNVKIFHLQNEKLVRNLSQAMHGNLVI